MKHVVMFSGGIGSFFAALRVKEKVPQKDLYLLFADTLMEDEDLYRFISDAIHRILGAYMLTNFIHIVEGRNPWQVFFDEKFLGNSRMDPCSKILKRQLSDKWFLKNCTPEDTVRYIGIDWSEEHRYIRLRDRFAESGWVIKAPLCDPPYIDKNKMIEDCRAMGIEPPRLYKMGFSHNNCGGFCIKAGKGHFANLLKQMPERYRFHEQKEQEIRAFLGKDVSILREQTNKIKKNLTLEELRERIESQEEIDEYDIGGCGCFVDEPDETELES